MYPLHVQNKALAGYAVANDEAEHKALSAMGYEPAFEAPRDEKAEVMAKLEAAGVSFDKRLGLEKLKALLP